MLVSSGRAEACAASFEWLKVILTSSPRASSLTNYIPTAKSMKTLVAALGAVALRLAATNFAAPHAVGARTVRMGCRLQADVLQLHDVRQRLHGLRGYGEKVARPLGAGASMLAAGAAPALVSGKPAREGVAAHSKGRVQTPDGEESFEEELEDLKRSGDALQHASEELKGDRQVVLEAVKQNGHALRHAAEELKRDRGVVMEAVKQSGYALQHASEELKRDRGVVMEAVKHNGHALRFASEELKRDRGVVMEAVKHNGHALRFASEELKGDRAVVLEAVKRNAHALQYASEELKGDRAVVLEAVKRNGDALQYASEELKRDRGVVTEAEDTCVACTWFRFGAAQAQEGSHGWAF